MHDARTTLKDRRHAQGCQLTVQPENISELILPSRKIEFESCE